MFETGTAATVRAFHVMPGMEGPEGELHDHDYRLDVVVARQDLDAEGMVIDLDVLDAELGRLMRDLDGANLHDTIRPPEAEAVTVEVFARWVHQALAPAVRQAGADHLRVRVWESAVAFGGFSGPP